MDLITEYIKRCKKAFELQALIKAKLKAGQYLKWLDDRFKNIRQEILTPSSVIIIKEYPHEFNILFTQDQLQEIYGDDFLCQAGLLRNWFDGKLSSEYPIKSMEQLWLHLVMKEKFNKTWNGEDWIKINEERK